MKSSLHSLLSDFESVFDPTIQGYNGAAGPFEAKVNHHNEKVICLSMRRANLWTSKNKFDELEKQYLNLSFLINKSNGGYHSVTAFADGEDTASLNHRSCPTLIPPFIKLLSGGILLLLISQVPFIKSLPHASLWNTAEALSITAATKHFSPCFIQAKTPPCILTDSKPCVQSFENLCCGEFSSSPCVATFLSTVSRYQASVHHVPGAAILPSDFVSSNASECDNPICQVCSFVQCTKDSVALCASVQSILSGTAQLPFTSRAACLALQAESQTTAHSCPSYSRHMPFQEVDKH